MEMKKADDVPETLVEPMDEELTAYGTSGMLTAVLRGEVEYAFEGEGGWLYLLYKNKRAVRINTEKALVLEDDYYEQRRH
jgi:hypothetical protein